MHEGFRGLDPCVHCGFCLPACPTFLATGDEADSPRGRIVLMRGVERGELAVTDPAVREHLDACLGCRGCEPVCPSGVRYGAGLEAVRERIATRAGLPRRARLVLAVFRRRALWWPLFSLARIVRATGLARILANRLSPLRMVAATAPVRPGSESPVASGRTATPPDGASVLLFRGCIMDRLFDHVHQATRRTLEANGYRVVDDVPSACCGALHLHAGDRAGAVALAQHNLDRLPRTDYIAVNSAGCGALLKDYRHLADTTASADFAGRVRDVAELLAAKGPRGGAPLDLTVAYDAPCHLQHAQGVHQEVLRVLDAVPGIRRTLLPGFDRCCGSAGIYSLLQPGLSREVLEDKLRRIVASDPRPDLIVTGNPGCLMQIGAGLHQAGVPVRVAHPVELLDWSYHRSGLYRAAAGG